jgi:aspartyl aminopeptidase
VVGAHTDSPNLRLKPRPDAGSVGIAKLGVEVYGGVLLNSWLDRDLGLSGRVAVRSASASGSVEITERLVVVDRPVARVPQLAIHLDREINERGLLLDRQRHLSPMWAEAAGERGTFTRWLAEELTVEADEIAGWDLMFHDLTPSRRLGRDEAWLAAPRIDNLASCHAGTEALLAGGGNGSAVAVLALFDHEEVGSMSATGAQGPLLSTVLTRRHECAGAGADDFHRSIASSVCISADGAHATHPNMAERHEPEHHIAMNAGPVIKRNANERYATTGVGQAIAAEACRAAGVPYQLFVNRTDLACGSTLGPLTAAQLGMTTVDMGMAQLSMHSARELCGATDPAMLVAALTAFLEG